MARGDHMVNCSQGRLSRTAFGADQKISWRDVEVLSHQDGHARRQGYGPVDLALESIVGILRQQVTQKGLSELPRCDWILGHVDRWPNGRRHTAQLAAEMQIEPAVIVKSGLVD